MAETVEEWLAEGNEITRERDEDTVIHESGGHEWCRDTSAWAEFRCRWSRTYGRRLPGTILRVVPYVCSEPGCSEYATVAADGKFWCDEHGDDE